MANLIVLQCYKANEIRIRRDHSGTVMDMDDEVYDERGRRKMQWPKYYTSVSDARKAAKSSLMIFREEVQSRPFNTAPIITMEKWEVKCTRENLLFALQIGRIAYESAEGLECWTVDNDGKLFSWKGWLDDDPDLKVDGGE